MASLEAVERLAVFEQVAEGSAVTSISHWLCLFNPWILLKLARAPYRLCMAAQCLSPGMHVSYASCPQNTAQWKLCAAITLLLVLTCHFMEVHKVGSSLLTTLHMLVSLSLKVYVCACLCAYMHKNVSTAWLCARVYSSWVLLVWRQ